MADDIPTATRLVVSQRDPSCVRCGAAPDHTHHRKGRRIPDPHRQSNLIRLCWSCHDWVHRHPAAAYEAGWMIPPSSPDDPVAVPVQLGLYGVVHLLDEGGLLAWPGDLERSLAALAAEKEGRR